MVNQELGAFWCHWPIFWSPFVTKSSIGLALRPFRSYAQCTSMYMWSPCGPPNVKYHPHSGSQFYLIILGPTLCRNIILEGRDCVGVGHNSFTLW